MEMASKEASLVTFEAQNLQSGSLEGSSSERSSTPPLTVQQQLLLLQREVTILKESHKVSINHNLSWKNVPDFDPAKNLIHFYMTGKKPKILLDENCYLLLRREPTKTFWRCSKYFGNNKTDRCKSSLVSTGKNVFVYGEHNHLGFTQSKKLSIVASGYTHPKKVNIIRSEIEETIYFDMATKHPKIILDQNSYLVLREKSTVYFGVGKQNPKLLVDGQSYRLFKKFELKTVWRCREYFGTRTDRCKSRITTTGKTVFISSDPHNHIITGTSIKRDENMRCSDVTICREIRDEFKELFK
ncbi:unnamed protein product [Ceutorhynchus assimilis]|uniref:FLYWCH-type domain-containing protein n=1 Tax=Ceutorhynchus assimilis TaxID=467358 RepID=A0A9N9MGH6_9CUCU|nr:unnamed protein product [Ceutorhynchus assimilis]